MAIIELSGAYDFDLSLGEMMSGNDNDL